MPAVKVGNLIKDFGEVRAVNGISLEVGDGEIFGLIGPNGAGKTTTLRIISTLLKATSGSVEVYGKSLEENPNQIRELISYLPEEAGAYENFTGKRYLEFMAGFFGKGNEPTSGLDVTNAQEVREIIKRHTGKGATVLLSSHNMFEVEYLCHRVAMINKGRIVESGKPSELKSKYKAVNLEEVFTGVVR